MLYDHEVLSNLEPTNRNYGEYVYPACPSSLVDSCSPNLAPPRSAPPEPRASAPSARSTRYAHAYIESTFILADLFRSRFTGNDNGAEPPKNGSGPDSKVWFSFSSLPHDAEAIYSIVSTPLPTSLLLKILAFWSLLSNPLRYIYICNVRNASALLSLRRIRHRTKLHLLLSSRRQQRVAWLLRS